MSEVLNKMKERRSIRKFKADMVPQEIIDQIAAERKENRIFYLK